MTRQEFIDDVTTWSELKDFCYDNECDECDSVYDDYDRNECIDNRLTEMASNASSWQDLLSELNDIPTGYDYYEEMDDGWRGLDDDDDFERYKGYVMDWMDNGDYWDEEDEDNEDEEYGEEPYYERPVEVSDEEPVAEEPIPVGELFTLCNSQLQTINGRTNK